MSIPSTIRSWLKNPRRIAARRHTRRLYRPLMGLESLERRLVLATYGDIAGTIYHDLNANGAKDLGEEGLSGWTVYLDLNLSGTFDNGGVNPEPSTLTNVDGDYLLTHRLAGNYRVAEVLPDGWVPSPSTAAYRDVAVTDGEVKANFFNVQGTPTTGGLQGIIWNDVDGDGVRTPATELGLASWSVFLDLNHDGVANPGEPGVLTAADGSYAFANLAPGDYNVHEVLSAGWEVTPAAGYDTNYTVTVGAGADAVAPDFANYLVLAGTVRGTVWSDLNSNGIRDAVNEPGVAGWTVFADLNSNGLQDPTEPATVSGADGSYLLTGVHPGTMQIVAASRADWLPTAPSSGLQTVTLPNGGGLSGVDFGNHERTEASIAGFAFDDINKNGQRDAGERGLDGISVYLDLNGNDAYDAGEPQTTTSTDLFFTPAVDEAGAYSFTHLARGSYTVLEIVPALLSATPAAQRKQSLTVGATEARTAVNFADVFRPNEIHGVKFDDANGNHVRDAEETGVGGVTIFLDINRNDALDAGEPSTVSAADGSYSFTDLSPGAYIVREVVKEDRFATFPLTTAGVLWPDGVSHPAVGNVTPQSITAALARGETRRQSVSLSMPRTGALTNMVDVFLLFDDTGSFVDNSPIVRAAFPAIISALQTSLPGIDLGFGVGRFEEYGNYAWEDPTGRPFILNQPIVAASTTGFASAIQAALDRTTPGYGGDTPETDFEALYQAVTGVGFDGNNNGTLSDSGPAGPAATQLTPGDSGDVPAFASFTPDPANSVLPAAGTMGGAGFRAGALPVILTATDTGFAYQPKGETSITGVNGVTLPIDQLTQASRPDTPFNSGAGIQQTITALNALGALVIGLGTNPERTLDPRQGQEAIARLTGAVNRSANTIDNGTTDPIAPGDPFYFQISSGFGPSVANGVISAIQNAVTNVAVNVTLRASDPRVQIINHTGVLSNVGAGQTTAFDVEFVGDGVPHRFDLQFVREGTNVVLGSIPVVLGTPLSGECYDFEDLAEGAVNNTADLGSSLRSVAVVNTVPSFGAGADQSVLEDAGPQILPGWATAISPGLRSDAGQQVSFVVSADNPALFSAAPAISAAGVLTYTPAPNAFGTATISVAIHDNGGTLGGGVDTSPPQTFTINVAAVNDPPTVATDASASPANPTGTAVALSVLGADDGGEPNLTYTWSVTSQPANAAAPSFSYNGGNAAKNATATFAKAGDYVFQVTIADAAGLSTTSSVNVTVAQTLTSLAVSPATVALYGGMTQQFAASAFDQFGDSLATPPAVTWTANAGAINASGLYTAPIGNASGLVTAASGAVAGTAMVNVTGLPQIVSWQSARVHGTAGEAALTIADDNKFSEPRNGGVRRLIVAFDRPIAPASFTAGAVQIAGSNLKGVALNLSSISISTSLRNGNTLGVIDFGANLPDQSRYLVRLQGITDPAGNALYGDNDRVFTNLKGDSSGDLRTNVTDLAYIQSALSTSINVAIVKQVRGDVNLDGRVNTTDLSAAWGMRNVDARNIPNPVISLGAALAVSAGAAPNTAPLAYAPSAAAVLDIALPLTFAVAGSPNADTPLSASAVDAALPKLF